MAGDPEFPELPQPGPSQLEIRFRRLLHRCMARAEQQHASDAPGAAAPWQTDPKFHCVSAGDAIRHAAAHGIHLAGAAVFKRARRGRRMGAARQGDTSPPAAPPRAPPPNSLCLLPRLPHRICSHLVPYRSTLTL